MIDIKLVAKAKPISEKIEAIDRSWREYINEKTKNIVRFPFPKEEEYEAKVYNKYIIIKGYQGKMKINKLWYDRKMYLLTNPIIVKKFEIYGQYDLVGRFVGFIGKPTIGFHFTGHLSFDSSFSQICVGDLKYENPTKIKILQKTCEDIVKSFEIINIESMGGVNPPPKDKSDFWRIMNYEDWSRTVNTLLEEGYIESIL